MAVVCPMMNYKIFLPLSQFIREKFGKFHIFVNVGLTALLKLNNKKPVFSYKITKNY